MALVVGAVRVTNERRTLTLMRSGGAVPSVTARAPHTVAPLCTFLATGLEHCVFSMFEHYSVRCFRPPLKVLCDFPSETSWPAVRSCVSVLHTHLLSWNSCFVLHPVSGFRTFGANCPLRYALSHFIFYGGGSQTLGGNF